MTVSSVTNNSNTRRLGGLQWYSY